MPKAQVHHPLQFEDEPKLRKNNVYVRSFPLYFKLHREMTHIRESIGLSEQEFIRLAIANMVISVKQGQFKVHLSKEYEEMVLQETGNQIFERLGKKLKAQDADVVETD